MATRLYPVTQNASVLEILAGVPAGTMSELKKFEAIPKHEFCTVSSLAAIAQAKHTAYQKNAELDPEVRHLSLRDHYEDIRSTCRCDPDYARYCYRTYILPFVDTLDTFLTFGWGRVQAPEAWLSTSHPGNFYWGGSVTDLSRVLTLLSWQKKDGRASQFWFDRRSWIGSPANFRVRTRSGSIFLSELQGLYWS